MNTTTSRKLATKKTTLNAAHFIVARQASLARRAAFVSSMAFAFFIAFVLSILFALALLSAPVSAFTLVTGDAQLNATLLYYEPIPAAPGSLLDVFIQIENTGQTARQVVVEFIDNDPFSINNLLDKIRTVEFIPAQEKFLVKYKVKVSKDAVPGTNYIKIQYSIENGKNAQTASLPIDIQSKAVSLVVENVIVEPEVLIPGSIGSLTFTLKNAALLKINEGTVKLDLDDVDIVPIGSTNQQRYTDVQAQETRIFVFKLAPSPSMTPGVYKIPIILNFTDQQGKGYSASELLGVRVGAKPDVSVAVDDVTTMNGIGDVLIKVTNKGIGEIKFVTLQLQDSAAYILLSGSAERYVGNIDSDDYKTARIKIDVQSSDVEIPLTITYLDALNTPYTAETVLKFKANIESGKGRNTGTILLVIIVVVIIGIVLWHRKRKAQSSK